MSVKAYGHRRVRRFDPITFVTRESGIKHGLVVGTDANTFATTFSGTLHVLHEHVDWIRGHHESGSPEAVALLAAHALSK